MTAGCCDADCLPLLIFNLHVFARHAFSGQLNTNKLFIGPCGKFFLDTFMAEIALDHRKSALRRNTDELIARGGFGSPTMFLDETDMYFGNDRHVLLDAAMAALRPSD